VCSVWDCQVKIRLQFMKNIHPYSVIPSLHKAPKYTIPFKERAVNVAIILDLIFFPDSKACQAPPYLAYIVQENTYTQPTHNRRIAVGRYETNSDDNLKLCTSYLPAAPTLFPLFLSIAEIF
jgi:hypothetical protein